MSLQMNWDMEMPDDAARVGREIPKLEYSAYSCEGSKSRL
jgi:hypothetical protein